MCHVIGLVAERAGAEREPWGTPHQLPPLAAADEAEAEEIRDQLFNGRHCRKLARKYGKLSVSVTFLTPEETLVNSPAVRRPEGWVLVVRVWTRDAAHAEIVRRAGAGQTLSYNVLKGA
jgi:hypothetical protein